MSVNLIKELKVKFENDGLSMYYQGAFDDIYTQKLIDASHASLQGVDGKLAKRRMAFLMAESFQNIVRHGIEEYKDTSVSNGIFGVRNMNPYLHIFSSNLIDEKEAEGLRERLDKIGKLDKQELREYYLHLLDQGDISEKGGGGLGLIEMAKRSGMPLQYSFTDSPEGMFFGLQVDQVLDKNAEAGNPLPIVENMELFSLLQREGVILFQKGDFSKEAVLPVLVILEENMRRPENYVRGKRLFHISVELLQNISRHGLIVNGKKEAVFTLSGDEDGFRFSTGNYLTKESADALAAKLDTINGLDADGLTNYYRKSLRESTLNDDDNAGVGLIDIKKFSNNKINYEFLEDEKGLFVIISVSF